MAAEPNPTAPTAAAGVFGDATIRRIEWLTLVIGGAGLPFAAWKWGWRGGLGMAFGVGLAWINFRWLKGTIRTFGLSATAQPQPADGAVETPRVPVSAYLKFFGRFILLMVGVYVILTHTSLPAASVFAGLFAPSAAVVAAILYELVVSLVRQGVRGAS